MKLEVEWKAKPASGITEVELSDLGVKSRKEWNNMSEEAQEKKLNDYLKDVDQIFPKVIEWSE